NGNRKVADKLVFVKGSGPTARLGDLPSFRNSIIIATHKNARALERDLVVARPMAVLTVVPDDRKIESQPVTNRGGGIRGGGPLLATISVSTARKLAAGAGVEEALVSLGEKDSGAVVKRAEKMLAIDLKVIDQPIHNPNVVGWLEGSDPKLKHEHIIIGAHLDHLGTRGDSVFPGADDNASGSTAILQIAKALAANGKRPRRSVLMIWFAAEEIGLVGSRHYANNPLKPIKDCICMLNIDMIGRNEEKEDEPASENEETIHLIGTRKITPAMHETLIEANRFVAYKFEYDEEDTVFRRSDQASFHDKGIPVAFVFGGFNPYYHQTTDTIRGINFSKISNCARLYYAATFLAAEHGHYSKARK
ncbi:MAG: M20/M25/M40 family metallo-hydrolase, partial [Planctomycetota bacterium]|nr:M20/M25/M40 family metallo-hydrolase [Planctomycetota bacterium]